MLEWIRNNFSRGILFIKNNPQILLSVFLLVVVSAGFLVSGQAFLNAAKGNQDRLEHERLGLMQDVFVQLVREKLYEPDFLNRSIQEIARINPSLREFKVVVRSGNEHRVIASLDAEEIGSIDAMNQKEYEYSRANPSSSFVFPEAGEGIRYWKAVRAVEGADGAIRAMILTRVSMEEIDALFERNVNRAYVILSLILIGITVLLIRHARIIDYAILYRRLKEVDQMKDDFVSMAAHELKTPLTVIRGYLSLLSPKIFSEEDKRNFGRINVSIDQLNSLISDILDVARIQQGRISLELKRTEAGAVTREVAETLSSLAEERGLTLSCAIGELPPIMADPNRLRQIMVNLVGNAIKYTPHGSVTVENAHERGMITIRVSDTGLGISAEDQKHLFTKFFRVRSKETDDIRGTGLGLWITAELVRQMSGIISVESIKGKGSVFTVAFPVAR